MIAPGQRSRQTIVHGSCGFRKMLQFLKDDIPPEPTNTERADGEKHHGGALNGEMHRRTDARMDADAGPLSGILPANVAQRQMRAHWRWGVRV